MAELARNASATIESALIDGDLSTLNPEQRVSYYQAVCTSLGLNPLTKPFDYIKLNGKLTLYARKDAADQLRKLNSISIAKPDIGYEDDWIIVTVEAHDGNGRTDSDVGVVSRKDMRGDFGNALMKAVTKAKRRVTLSICGLGMLDETEVETITDARPMLVEEVHALTDSTHHWIERDDVRKRFWTWVRGELDLTEEQVHEALGVEHISDYDATMADAKTVLEAYAAKRDAAMDAPVEYAEGDPARPF